MSLVNLIDAELAFGLFPLLDRANLTVLAGASYFIPVFSAALAAADRVFKFYRGH